MARIKAQPTRTIAKTKPRALSPDKRVLPPGKRVNDAEPSPSGQKPSKRAKMSAVIDEDAFAAYRGDALNFSDFEYDANASESDEAEETSSECGNAGSEGEFDDSELESDKDQDFFCDFNEEDEDEDEEEEDEEEDDEGQFDDAPNYVGSFDLYDMHEFSDVYYSDDKSSSVQPEALYEELLGFQATSKKDAGITIPENYAACYDGKASVDKYGSYTLDAGTAGELRQNFIQDPYEERPYDIIITDIEDVAWEDLKFTSMYGRPKGGAWNGRGLEGDLEVEGALEGCTTDKAAGSIKMRPVWRKVGTDGKPMEFFEGSLIFETSLNPIFARKLRVRSSKESFDFWAIRAVR